MCTFFVDKIFEVSHNSNSEYLVKVMVYTCTNIESFHLVLTFYLQFYASFCMVQIRCDHERLMKDCLKKRDRENREKRKKTVLGKAFIKRKFK